MKNQRTNNNLIVSKTKGLVKKTGTIQGTAEMKKWASEQKEEAKQAEIGRGEKTGSWKIHPSEKQWRQDMKKLTPTQRCILIDLGFYQRKSKDCFPSQTTIAKNLNVNISTIERNMPILKKMKLVKIIGTIGKVNHYKLNISF